ncbi:hypothetical protein KEM56_002681 [Ascosphaera pollenicola]|nr:hypothetical protein KEM56_002681 [Ascosphaera pollenicola]
MEKRKLSDQDADHQGTTTSPPAGPKRTRVIGPALPPGFGNTDDASDSYDDKGNDSGTSDDSDDDDDYGPTLPPTGANAAGQEERMTSATSKSYEEEEPKPLRRDDWMLKPPDSSDWSSRVDPTKIRNRKFNMGRSASSSTGPADTWTETVEEKKKRLAAELMGVRAPANQRDASAAASEISELDLEKKKQVEEYNAQNRKSTLYSRHKDARKKQGKEDDDDPSARPFDREKDIRGPTKISNAQVREFINRSSDFGTKFSGGKFL